MYLDAALRLSVEISQELRIFLPFTRPVILLRPTDTTLFVTRWADIREELPYDIIKLDIKQTAKATIPAKCLWQFI